MITLPVLLIAVAALLLLALMLGLFLQRRRTQQPVPSGPRTVADLVAQRADREPAPVAAPVVDEVDVTEDAVAEGDAVPEEPAAPAEEAPVAEPVADEVRAEAESGSEAVATAARSVPPLGDDVPWRRAAQIAGSAESEPVTQPGATVQPESTEQPDPESDDERRVPALALLRRPPRRPVPTDEPHPFSTPRLTAVPARPVPPLGLFGAGGIAAGIGLAGAARPADPDTADRTSEVTDSGDDAGAVPAPSATGDATGTVEASDPADAPAPLVVDDAAGAAGPVEADAVGSGPVATGVTEVEVAVSAPAEVADAPDDVAVAGASDDATDVADVAAAADDAAAVDETDRADVTDDADATERLTTSTLAAASVGAGAGIAEPDAPVTAAPQSLARPATADPTRPDDVTAPADVTARLALVEPVGDAEPAARTRDEDPSDRGAGLAAVAGTTAVAGALLSRGPDRDVDDRTTPIPRAAGPVEDQDFPEADPDLLFDSPSPPVTPSPVPVEAEPEPASRRPPRDPQHVAAEQAAADLALLRTFGDPSARPERAPVVALEGAFRPERTPAVGAAQPVRFRAVRHDGTSVAEATVALLDDLGREVSTGRSGSGELTAPHPGAYVLVATAPDHQPGAVAVAVGDAPVDVEVQLVRSAALVGTVTGEDGPIAGARVTLVQDGEVVEVAETDADGAYLVADLAAGEYAVSVAAAGCEADVVLVGVAEEAEIVHDVELEPAGVSAA